MPTSRTDKRDKRERRRHATRDLSISPTLEVIQSHVIFTRPPYLWYQSLRQVGTISWVSVISKPRWHLSHTQRAPTHVAICAAPNSTPNSTPHNFPHLSEEPIQKKCFLFPKIFGHVMLRNDSATTFLSVHLTFVMACNC